MIDSNLEINKNGLYCPRGNFYVDPWKPVDYAVITHGHADHARWGSSSYLAQNDCEPILKLRLGSGIKLETLKYGETKSINGVKVSLHPAGHIIGSSQLRIEYNGYVSVVSGDYKLEDDNLSTPFELLECNTFITESTFGLPIYKWQSQNKIFDDINSWWEKNSSQNICSVLFAYSLGKAQRVLQNIDSTIGEIFAHGAVANVNSALVDYGIKLRDVVKVDKTIEKQRFRNALVIAPPSANSSPWLKKMQPYTTAIASGWMNVRGNKRRRAIDSGFVISDHADWEGLNSVIGATGAEKVLVTHGYKDVMVKWLNERGINSSTLETEFDSEKGEDDSQ